TKVGGEFVVNQTTYRNQTYPVITATDDGGFIIAYTHQDGSYSDGSGYMALARRFDADGNALGDEFRLNATTEGNQWAGDIGDLGNGQFVALMTSPDSEGEGVYQRLFNSDGTAPAIEAPEIEALSVSRVFGENALNAGLQRIDTDGKAAVSDADSADFSGGRLIVSPLGYVKYNDDFGPIDGAAQHQLGFVSGRVSVAGGVVSVDGIDIGTLSSDGQDGAPLILDLNAAATPANLEVLIEHLGYGNSSDDPVSGISYQILLEDGDGAASDPYVIEIEITPESDDAAARVGLDTRVETDTSYDAERAWSAETFDPVTGAINGYVTVWNSNGQDGSGYGVYAQRFDLQGEKLGGEFQVNSYSSSDQRYSHIAGLTDGGFVITWSSYHQDGSYWGIYAARYDANGDLVAGQEEVRVNSYTSSHQYVPYVVGTSDGGYQIAWRSNGQDGNGYGVYTQRYDNTGAKIGGETLVNQTTSGGQYSEPILALPNGRVFMGWQSSSGDGSGYAAYGRFIDADGNLEGDEFLLATTSAGDQNYGRSALLSDGTILVAWNSYGQDGSESGVYIRKFAQDGTALSEEIRVNDQTSGAQYIHDIVALDNGRFVVIFNDTSRPSPGSGEDVLAQVFDNDLSRVDSEFIVNADVSGSQRTAGAVALAGGNFVVTFTDTQPSPDQIRQQIFGTASDFPVSEAPELTGLSGTWTITEAQAQAGLALAPAGALTLTDPDSANFDGGVLRLSRTTLTGEASYYSGEDGEGQDSLSFAAPVTLNGSDISIGGQIIGQLISDGQNGADLEILFTAAATPALVEDLLRAVQYQNSSDDPAPSRSYLVELTDGDGGALAEDW
ncbi:MAG: hypothetical protein ACPGVJ_03800, partial [Mangrovicoccus sp.]